MLTIDATKSNLRWLKTGFNLDTVSYSLAFCRQADCRRNSWICFVCWPVPEKVVRNQKQIHHTTFQKRVKLLRRMTSMIKYCVPSYQNNKYIFNILAFLQNSGFVALWRANKDVRGLALINRDFYWTINYFLTHLD